MATEVRPALPYDIGEVRRVVDANTAPIGAVVTPREDARKLRSNEKIEDNCECILEVYELLWRWGNLDRKNRAFKPRFGFELPSSVVVVKGRPYAWYFMSSSGALLRKMKDKLSMGKVEQEFCRETRASKPTDVVAVWYPMATQFAQDRCEDRTAKFLTADGVSKFLGTLNFTVSGVLQKFIQPFGIYNFLVRAVKFHDKVSIAVRMNRNLLASNMNANRRCMTFEGWGGLSSPMCKYDNSRHPMMEEQILKAAAMLSDRITQERVRQMHFMLPSQYIALYFKIDPHGSLMFSFAGILEETEVILQTQRELMMEDDVMRAPIPNVGLLPGGSGRRFIPVPAGLDDADEGAGQGDAPLTLLVGQGAVPPGATMKPNAPRPPPISKLAPSECFLPLLDVRRPDVPPAPYSTLGVPHQYYLPDRQTDSMKVPLISFQDASEQSKLGGSQMRSQVTATPPPEPE
jgi:hypothetical protein